MEDEAYERLMRSTAKKEPKRPADVPPKWIWRPTETRVREGGETEWDPGYWVEPPGEIEARRTELLARRRGYCGAFGPAKATA